MDFIVVAFLSALALGKVSQAKDPLEYLNCQIRGDVAQLFLTTDTTKILITDNTVYDNTKPTFFVIHGWTENSDSSEYREIAIAVYTETQGNVILVDYKEIGAKSYTCALIITKVVGDYVSNFISNQTKVKNMHPSRIHLIGHSLGGQIAGYIGRRVVSMTKSKIARISGLDPAGPLFNIPMVMSIPGLALSQEDADVVDILHTSLIIGASGGTGSVDFYVKGFLYLPLLFGPCRISSEVNCTHQMSKTLFRESIQSCGLVGTNFLFNTSKAVYGFHMPLSITGMYFLQVNSNPPYGMSKPACN